jgi:hypothetical protein
VGYPIYRVPIGTSQVINPAKCSLFFGSGCSMDNKEIIRSILKVQHITQEEKYL